MIFYICSIVIFLTMLIIQKKHWSNIWSRIIFIFVSLLTSLIFILFAKQTKIFVNIKEPVKRTIIVAVDVSASMDIDFLNFKNQISKLWQNYNIEIIPFSDRIFGENKSNTSSILTSLRDVENYININYDENNVAALVIVSDGNETENTKLAPSSTILHTGNFFKNVIYKKSLKQKISIDKSVFFTKVPRFIPRYKKERVHFSVSVYGTKMDTIPVQLMLNKKNLGTVYVDIKNNYGEGFFDLIIKEAGLSLLEISVEKDSREIVLSNNNDAVVVEAIIDDYRVLHLSGHPSIDTSFVRSGLQNIPGLDMISFFILRKPGQLFSEKEGELSLIPFPTDQLFQKELENFDVITINDFKLSNFLMLSYINNIVDFVEKGGGLLIFGGSESFLNPDYNVTQLTSVIPIESTLNSNWQNINFAILPTDIVKFTQLRNIKFPNNKNIFQGLNKVQVKSWGNVFFETSEGIPVIVGGIVKKGRVLLVLTDSLWRLSYNLGIKNESILKHMMRYLLGVSVMPVKQIEDKISFNDDLVNKDINIKNMNTRAKLTILEGKEEIISLIDTIKIPEGASVYNVDINNESNLIERYKLVSISDTVSTEENTFNSLGKDFLRKISVKSDGVFLEVDKGDIFTEITKLKLKQERAFTKNIKKEKHLYEDKMFLALFLYLVIFAFYLKSRYCD